MNFKEYLIQKRKERFIKTLTSDNFKDFFNRNAKPLQTMFTYYECAMMEVETKFNVLNQEFLLSHDSSPIEAIKSRLKTMESLLEKINRYNCPLNIEAIENNITDIAGIRIICSFPEDIYSLADCFVRQDDITLIEKRDYIKNPKPNGYRSLHLIISVPIYLERGKRNMKVEVQLRTIAMDFWASLEHKLRYKKNLPPELADRLSEELLTCANYSADLDMRMQNIRRQLTGDSSEIDEIIEAREWL